MPFKCGMVRKSMGEVNGDFYRKQLFQMLVFQFVLWKEGTEPMVFPFLEGRDSNWSSVVEDDWEKSLESHTANLLAVPVNPSLGLSFLGAGCLLNRLVVVFLLRAVPCGWPVFLGHLTFCRALLYLWLRIGLEKSCWCLGLVYDTVT